MLKGPCVGMFFVLYIRWYQHSEALDRHASARLFRLMVGFWDLPFCVLCTLFCASAGSHSPRGVAFPLNQIDEEYVIASGDS